MGDMKTIWIHTILFFILFSSNLVSQPKLKIPIGTKFSFGDIVLTSKVQKSVVLKNIGKDTLDISNVHATCGCTAAMLSNNRIAPRDSGMLNITFDASRFSGTVQKGVTFNTNDPKQLAV